MALVVILRAFNLVDDLALHPFFPPLEHALKGLSTVAVAGAFLHYLSQDQRKSSRYIFWGCLTVVACYLVTFYWWAVYIEAHPWSSFGKTWCDWLFRSTVSFWLLAAGYYLACLPGSWMSKVVGLALAFFFIDEAGKLVDMSFAEAYKTTLDPIRHSAHILGVFILGYVYMREMHLERARAVKKLKQNEQRLYQLAHYDHLTGLPNRLLFNDRLEQALVNAVRNSTEVALLFLDIDRFKMINDSLGHLVGDRVLIELASRLKGCVRESDTVARLGGDEFVVLLKQVHNIDSITRLAQKLLAQLAAPLALEREEIFSTVSIGISIFPADGNDAQTLMKHADVAMYRAKDNGRNGYQYYCSDLNARAYDLLKIEGYLRRAVEQGEMFLCYQPKVSLASGMVVGFESLIRWRHPRLGLLMPDDFIPLAEETGLIVPIGNWVLRQSCKQLKAWHEQFDTQATMAVNISPRQFWQGDLVKTVAEALRESQLEARFLKLEITESMVMTDVPAAIETMSSLSRLGVNFAIDDFGTGYSSLSYLKQFPLSTLKIDRSFVSDLPDDRNDAAIASAVISLGHHMDLTVTAEGIETEEQLHFLRQQGCDLGQGYLFSRPVPPEEIPHFFGKRYVAPIWSLSARQPVNNFQ